MRDPVEEHRPEYDRSRNDWSIAAAIAVTIVICIATFIWIFIELEPLLSDFVSEADVMTPTIVTDATREP
ncbi:MAG TPA: hypothetical protein VMM78_08975 [Thermomicrobiales bacterium]|nr:hypothetical protein [Thermomicrobiales bacterium]